MLTYMGHLRRGVLVLNGVLTHFYQTLTNY